MQKSANINQESSDQDLIAAIRHGDENAMEIILKRYKNMVASRARRLFLQGGDQEDLIQEGMIGLYQAILRFNPKKLVPLSAYASQVVDSRLYDAIRTAARKKHQPLNQSLSLDFQDNRDSTLAASSLFEIISNEEAIDPENLLLDKERMKKLESFLKKHLSKYEDQVASLYLKGKTYNEIAEELDVSYKSVDGALQRVRRKFNDYREELN